jgi:hypothetical protein
MTTATDRLAGLSTSVAVKAPCKAVSTIAITQSGEQTIGGVACVDGDRYLYAITAGSALNGIWVVRTGAHERAKDFDGNRDVVCGTKVLTQPSEDAADDWVVTTVDPIVIGTTVIVFERFADVGDSLRTDLASTASTSLGDALVGVKRTLSGAAATTLHAVMETMTYALKRDFGAAGNGTTDDTAVLVAAIAAVPEGSTLVLDGLFRITSTVAWNRRVSPWCFGADKGILLDCGATVDGIVFYGTDASLINGLNGLDFRLNVYGRANACEHAVTFNRLDRSRGQLIVRAGATAYAVRVRGCLINSIDIDSSVNYDPPISTPGTPVHHMLVEYSGVATGAANTVTIPASPSSTWTKTSHGFTSATRLVFTGVEPPPPFVLGAPYFIDAGTLTADIFKLAATDQGTIIATTSGAGGSFTVNVCTAVASNTNTFRVNFEGADDGYVQSAMPGEGWNTVTGEIEGLTGFPFYVNACTSFTVTDMKMEANGENSAFIDCDVLRIGPGTYNGTPDKPFSLTGCQGYAVDGYFGDLLIDATCTGGMLGQIESTAIGDVVILDDSANQTAPITNTTLRNIAGGPGSMGSDCIFTNPFGELFGANDPAVGPPVGFTLYGAGGSAVTSTATVYPGNPFIKAIRAYTSNAGTYENGVSFTNGTYSPTREAEWFSVFVPLYAVSTGALPSLRVLIDGSLLYTLTTTAAADVGGWVEHRASFQVPAGKTWAVYIALIDNATGTYKVTSGFQYEIGGCMIYHGAIPPKYIHNSHSHQNHVVPTVAYAPPFVGCKAFVTGTGKWYLARDTTSSADWIILN